MFSGNKSGLNLWPADLHRGKTQTKQNRKEEGTRPRHTGRGGGQAARGRGDSTMAPMSVSVGPGRWMTQGRGCKDKAGGDAVTGFDVLCWCRRRGNPYLGYKRSRAGAPSPASATKVQDEAAHRVSWWRDCGVMKTPSGYRRGPESLEEALGDTKRNARHQHPRAGLGDAPVPAPAPQGTSEGPTP